MHIPPTSRVLSRHFRAFRVCRLLVHVDRLPPNQRCEASTPVPPPRMGFSPPSTGMWGAQTFDFLKHLWHKVAIHGIKWQYSRSLWIWQQIIHFLQFFFPGQQDHPSGECRHRPAQISEIEDQKVHHKTGFNRRWCILFDVWPVSKISFLDKQTPERKVKITQALRCLKFPSRILGASMKGFESKAAVRRLVLQHLEHILQWPLHLLATHQVATRPTLRGANLWDMPLASDSF